MKVSSRPPLPGVVLRLVLLSLLSRSAAAQTATVSAPESVRSGPDGTVIAVVQPGTPVPVTGGRDGWIEVELEGWVWIPSLQNTDRGGFDLVVSASDGENLRTEPSGAILARLPGGTLLTELRRTPGWIQVRRRGWLPAAAARTDGAAVPAGEPIAATAGPAPATRSPASGSTVESSLLRAGPQGAWILAGPDGDTLGRTVAGGELEVVAREGSWVRVRLDGWTWVGGGAAAPPPEDGAVPAVTAAELANEPDRFEGRVVAMQLQFISLERAERVRTDFFEGEPFLLTREPGEGGRFVYVAVPPERLTEMEGLVPLERTTVVGRVRSSASALTGSPILDLLRITRGPGGP